MGAIFSWDAHPLAKAHLDEGSRAEQVEFEVLLKQIEGIIVQALEQRGFWADLRAQIREGQAEASLGKVDLSAFPD
jgi:hypothetical protein